MNIDLLIVGGTMVDGAGSEPYSADLAIKDGRICDLGRIDPPTGVTVLDARGLLVTPGFIDIHSHSDFTLTVDSRAVSSITQGVTLEVVGNCGHGCAPIGNVQRARSNIYGCKAAHEIRWRSVAEYLEVLESCRPAVNVVTLVPNGNLRLAAVESLDRPSTADELMRMKKMLAQGLEEGAFGFSTGLEYGPERACPEEEITELCRVVSRVGGFYATHTRNRNGEAEEAIAEGIRTSSAAGVALQISHISVVARLVKDGRKAVGRALQQVDQAQKSGLDVRFDMHTRLFGTTTLSAALPPWALQGDQVAVAARLRDPAARREMKQYRSIVTALARGDWSKIVLFHFSEDSPLSGQSIAQISEDRGLDPMDVIYDLLLAEIDHLHELMVIATCYHEDDVQAAFEHPHCMIGSDATALATDGPLAGSSFHGAYTWASWFFRHFVRDTKILSPQEAVRRVTSLPAQRLGLRDRGVLRIGACADLAIFDPDDFYERGTILQPNRTASGMTHVVVNGTIALKDGVLTGKQGGKILRRG